MIAGWPSTFVSSPMNSSGVQSSAIMLGGIGSRNRIVSAIGRRLRQSVATLVQDGERLQRETVTARFRVQSLVVLPDLTPRCLRGGPQRVHPGVGRDVEVVEDLSQLPSLVA